MIRLASAMALFVLSACAAMPAPQPTLAGAPWLAESIAGRPVLARTPALTFEVGSLSGTGGCNRIFGSYQSSGASLAVSGMGATRMACEPAIMSQESAFLAALDSVRAYRIEESRLLLLDDGGEVVLVLRPSP
jgi:putative lipoprotein